MSFPGFANWLVDKSIFALIFSPNWLVDKSIFSPKLSQAIYFVALRLWSIKYIRDGVFCININDCTCPLV